MNCMGRFKIPLTGGVVNWIRVNFVTYSEHYLYNLIKRKMQHLPHFAAGVIVPGFGRGSRELGIPTANYPLDVVKALPADFVTGIYYGWSNVDNGEVYKMVMSVGWNPFYDNKEKSMETHIIHEFGRDLYGSILKVCIVGYLRPETNFDSLESLISTIKADICQATDLLEQPAHQELKNATFFKEPLHDIKTNGHT